MTNSQAGRYTHDTVFAEENGNKAMKAVSPNESVCSQSLNCIFNCFLSVLL